MNYYRITITLHNGINILWIKGATIGEAYNNFKKWFL